MDCPVVADCPDAVLDCPGVGDSPEVVDDSAAADVPNDPVVVVDCPVVVDESLADVALPVDDCPSVGDCPADEVVDCPGVGDQAPRERDARLQRQSLAVWNC